MCTTLPAEADSKAFGRTLVEERLAACVSAHPGLYSVYRWNDGVEDSSEQQVMIKTTRARLEALERRFDDLHPYDLPELLVLPVVGGSRAYLEWVWEGTQPSL